MHAGWKKARTVALATGIAAALTAGAVTPAGAAAEQSAAKTKLTAAGLKGGSAKTWITLITGDRVGVNAKGKPVALKRAKGREHIPVQVQTLEGHAYAIPLDAARLIQKGRVDRRLFDITTLSRAEYRKSQAKGLGYIVTYKGSKPEAKAELHAADGAKVTHNYSRLNTEAVTTAKQDTENVWAALTNEPKDGSPYATAESGLKTVWLDAIQKASLDESVAQLGAPTAWAAGYDGAGVKIAVLDTGVDETHADLATQVVDEKNFTDSATADDKFGHGTHVASIAAGTGAKSGGTYKGVAPGAQLLSGKVLSDDGYGEDSWILAGLEWAAASGAKVVNLSLGGTDTPGADVLEEAVNNLSASTGTLFVIAAGNEGEWGDSTVGSPGSADAALTVGAVDKSDVLAGFSSRGPRVGDGAIKPDVTAPGVDIAAAAAPGSLIEQEVGQDPEGYLTISGTSMATPHVAGAAAILAQEHPDWTGRQIKAALTGSTKAGDYNPFQQGSGRVDLTKAITQTVIADPVSLSFGTAAWPHADDEKQTKTVTYTNTGTADVTLDLTADGKGPQGNAAPEGFFTLSATQITVPAGGTATAGLTVDTTLGGDVNGAYSAYVVAKAADGQTVRTAAAVTRETESYTLTIKHLDRDGNTTGIYDDSLLGLTGDVAGDYYSPYDADGTATIRVPKGRYVLASNVFVGDGESFQGVDWINAPNLVVSGDAEITVDARTAKPIDLTVPNSSATSVFASPDFTVSTADYSAGFGWWLDSYDGFRSAHLGSAATAGELHETYAGSWQAGTTEYSLAYGRSKTKLATGYTKHAKASELAKVNMKLGSSVKNKKGLLFAMPYTGGGGSSASAFERKLPRSYKLYVNAGSSVKWSFDFIQIAADDNWEAFYSTAPSAYKGGKSYGKAFNIGVFGPKVSKSYGIYREGNQIFGYLPLLADGSGHDGSSTYDKARTTLYRNGEKVGSNTDPVTGEPFTVPAGNAKYKLTTSLTRSSGVAAVSTKVTAAWTFSSKKVSDLTKLPASAVKFSPSLTAASTSKAKASVKVPVKVLGSAAGRNLKSLKVYVSFDGGKHWTKLTVKKGKVTVKNPKAGKKVSFKANVTDKKGNTLSQVIYNAYVTK